MKKQYEKESKIQNLKINKRKNKYVKVKRNILLISKSLSGFFSSLSFLFWFLFLFSF